MLKILKIFALLFAVIVFHNTFAQGGAPSCAQFQANFESYQSCATSIPFQNSVGGNNENFTTTCINENFQGPTWFFIKIQTPGNIILQINQVNNAGIGTDVDFVLWGPFTNLSNVCSQLNLNTEVDCSWLPDSVEIVTIPNALQGEMYVLLIDNYSNQAGEITITQIGGTGSSDCSFLSSVDITDINGNEISQTSFCKPETTEIVATIDVTDFTGNVADLRFNYKWYKGNTLLNTITNSLSNTNILSGISESGIYRVETTAYDSTDPTVDVNTLPVSTDEIELKFHVLPVVTIQSSTTDCLDSNPILQSTITNSATFDLSVDLLSYQWYKNGIAIPGINTASFTPTSAGIYTLGVKNGGCNEVISNAVIIKEKPNVTLSEDKTFCENDTFTLTSTITNSANLTNVTFQWFQNNVPIPGATSNSLMVSTAIQSVNSTATYFLKSFEQGSCESNSNTVTIRINKQPILNSTPISLLQCDYISPNNDGIAVTNLTEVYNEITNNTPNITLFYYSDISLTQPILNPETFTNTSVNQTIYVVGVDQNVIPNCTAGVVATIQLTVNPTSLSVYPDIPSVCPIINQNYGNVDFTLQESVIQNTFFSGNPVDISFYLNATDASTEQNELTNNSEITIGIQTIYTRVETNNDCIGVGTFEVEIKNPPIQTTVSTVLLCENETITLNMLDAEALLNQNPTVQTGYFNSFANATSNSTILNKNIPQTFSVGTNTLYVRLFDSATQCFSIIDFNIIVFPNPVIFSPNPISICGDTSSTFDLTIRNSQITGNNINYQVFYYETQADLLADNFIPTPNSFVSTSKTIFIKVVDPTNNNCFSTTTLNLSVVSIPGSLTNPTPLELCDDSGFATFNLTQRALEIAGTSSLNNITIRYYENFANAQNNASNFIQNPINFTNTISTFQTIYVRVTSNLNIDSETGLACFRVLELNLHVRPFPENNLRTKPYYICIDENGTVLTEAFVNTYLSNSDYTFVWFDAFDGQGNEIVGENGNTFTTSIEGEFSVKVVNISNVALCTRFFNFTTRKTLTPDSITLSPENLIGFENENSITATVTPPSADYQYSIVPDYWQDSPVFTNIPAGDFTMKVRSKFGCGEISIAFTVLDFPVFFTPNGDGFNDKWKIKGSPIVEIIHIYIFDRYGKLLKEIGQNGNGWDGTFNGNPVPSDDYWFKAIYIKDGNKKEFKSNFSLKR